MRSLALAGVLVIVAGVPAFAQQILKNEPPNGGMRTGEIVYVDNGKCAKGQVQKITGGAFAGGRNSASGGTSRTKECVPRP